MTTVLDNFIKTYNVPRTDVSYTHTKMVQHNGTVIAFALDSRQRIWYTVLDLENKDIQSPLDVNYWLNNPHQLIFPKELTRVGYGVDPNAIVPDPVPKKREIVPDPVPKKREKDKTEDEKFLGTTGRLTASVPFQVLSDGQYIYVFRQAIKDAALNVDSTLLVDRFVFVGTELKQKLEARYQRSRHKTRPQSNKDSLDSKDLEGKPFYEPTQELRVTGSLTDGRFAVLLVPTSIPNMSRWQIFRYNAKTQKIDSFNIERSGDGLFNTQGTQFYTSPVQEHQKSVYEASPGKCPFTDKALIPIQTKEGYAESALHFDGKNTYVELPEITLDHSKGITIEAWLCLSVSAQPEVVSSQVLQILEFGNKNADDAISLTVSHSSDGYHFTFTQKQGQQALGSVVMPVKDEDLSKKRWIHIAISVDPEGTITTFRDGKLIVFDRLASVPTNITRSQNFIGKAIAGSNALFAGVIDEVRVWNYARLSDSIHENYQQRLIGNEDLLLGYWRFDEGAGTVVGDQTDYNHLGTLKKQDGGNFTPEELSQVWVDSDAPIGDNSGVQRSSFTIQERTITSGMSAILYYQQENLKSGYSDEAKPMKKSARVMLAVATNGGTKDNEIAVLDFALSREGKLVLIPDTLNLQSVNSSRDEISYGKLLNDISSDEEERSNLPNKIKESITSARVPSRSDIPNITLVERDFYLNEFSSNPKEFPQPLSDCLEKFMKIREIINSKYVPDGSKEEEGFTSLILKEKVTKIENDVKTLQDYLTTFRGEQGVLDLLDGKQFTYKIRSCKTNKVIYNNSINISTGFSVGSDSGGDNVYQHWTLELVEGTQPTYKIRNCQTKNVIYNNSINISTGFSVGSDSGGDNVDQHWTLESVEGTQSTYKIRNCQTKNVIANFDIINDITMFAALPDQGGDNVNLLWTLESVGYPSYIHLQERSSTQKLKNLDNLVVQYNKQIEIYKCIIKSNDRLIELTELITNKRKNLVGEIEVPMPLVHTDRFGLTLSGAILEFAFGKSTPTLFDSANGKLGLYFQGNKDQFFAAYFDTFTQRASYQLKTDLAELVLVANSDDADMDSAAVSISGKDEKNDTCTLTLSAKGHQETWTNLPRQPRKIAAILNGDANPDSNSNLYYDYKSVQVQPANLKVSYGSTLFRALAGQTDGKLANQTPTEDQKTALSGWKASGPGNAIELDGIILPSTIEKSSIAKFAVSGDITLETWVKPSFSRASGNNMRLIHYSNVENKEGYLLNLYRTLNRLDDYVFGVIVGKNNTLLKTQDENTIFNDNTWTHIAAAYHQSYALQFDGIDDYLEVENAQNLNINSNLTIELTLQVSALGKEQGLITKGRVQSGGIIQRVPYALHLNSEGKLVFYAERKDAPLTEIVSSEMLTLGTIHHVAVVREQHTDEIKEPLIINDKPVTVDGKPEGKPVEVTKSVKQWENIRLYLNGKEVGNHAFENQATGTNSASVEIAKAYTKEGNACFFNGAIGEIRIWNTARSAENLGKAIQGNEQGLVSWWRLEENEGLITFDRKASNHAVLTGATWINNPDQDASTFHVYVNGVFKPTEKLIERGPTELPYSDAQFSLGGCVNNGQTSFALKGILEETRIWKTARTQEQIQDNLFRRLLGEKADLIAYYKFDAEDKNNLLDDSGNSNHLPYKGGTYRLSDAPVAYETPQIRNALAGISTAFNSTISSSPAVQEYGDMQTGSDGQLTGVMKRCYSYIKDGNWQLITGFKIGNIITEWVGQAQYAPQIIGYIEGAPPVPGENVVEDPQDKAPFSSLQLIESESVQYSYSASKQASLDVGMAMALKSGAAVESQLLMVTAPLGIGVAISPVAPAEIDVNLEGNASVKTSTAWSSETNVGFSRNLTHKTDVSLTGSWKGEKEHQKFVPENIGIAIVKSDTVDIFALRLADDGSNALIAYRYQPNLDIPKDWNMIPFKINPYYTKQGTLDGTIGFNEQGAKNLDEDYQNAKDYGEYSYFKPKEAYNLKNRIEQLTQEEQVYYDNFETLPFDTESAKAGAILGALAGGATGNSLGAGVGAGIGALTGGVVGGLNNEKKLPKQLVQRNFVNTYVWTAAGGFFAETTNISQTQQETIGGTFNLEGSASGKMSTDITIFGVAAGFEMEGSLGGSINLTKTKSKTSEKSFGIDVNVNTPSGSKLPGQVDAYRFLTFYLEGSKENFDMLVNKVIDPNWLAESKDPNAIAIREAINAQSNAKKDSEKSLPWRVMHRVTYISRVLPKVNASASPIIDSALGNVDISSNYELIKRLEPFVRNKTSNYITFTEAVRSTIENYMPELKAAENDIVKLACQYFQVIET